MDDLINECIQIHGIDMYYLPRTSLSSFDPLFGDDPTRQFKDAYPCEVYVQSVDNFEGGELFSKFGLNINKQAKFLVTRRSFHKNVPSTYTRPREGDILYLTTFKAFFEIKYVDEEHFFYTFGETGIYGYSMITEKWSFADEQVSVGINEIDNKIDELIVAYNLRLNSNGIGSFQIGERVFAGSNPLTANANATVIQWDRPSLTLSLKNINGSFVPTGLITGANSGSLYYISSANTRDDVNGLLDNNSDISTEANTILNWAEDNPFGEPQR